MLGLLVFIVLCLFVRGAAEGVDVEVCTCVLGQARDNLHSNAAAGAVAVR